MYIEEYLKNRLLYNNTKNYKTLCRVAKWVESSGDCEVYVYEDFNEDSRTNKQFYRIDIIGNDKEIYTRANIIFGWLVAHFVEDMKKVRENVEARA